MKFVKILKRGGSFVGQTLIKVEPCPKVESPLPLHLATGKGRVRLLHFGTQWLKFGACLGLRKLLHYHFYIRILGSKF